MSRLAGPEPERVWEWIAGAVAGPATEARRPDLADLDLRPTLELVRLMNAEDATVAGAVATAAPAIAAAVDEIAGRLARDGRLVYVGAGTSGRLAEVDASECEATFAVSYVYAVVAVSASGTRPAAVGALGAARAALKVASSARRAASSRAALTASCSSPPAPSSSPARRASRPGRPGTAEKLVLNMLSTLSVIRLGKTFGNLMVDVCASNEKLRGRARRIVAPATGAPADEVEWALQDAGGSAEVAVVSVLAGVDAAAARERLAAVGGNMRTALGER